MVDLNKMIKHLKIQIESAEKLSSDFVYITLNEGKKALELAEKEQKDKYITCCYSGHIKCDDSWMCCDCPFDNFQEDRK